MSEESERLQRVCFVVAVPQTEESFLRPHFSALSGEYDINVVANFPTQDCFPAVRNVKYIHVAIKRPIHPIADTSALIHLLSVFRQGKFDVVHSVTPKAGLLAMLAAAMAGVPHRIHWFTGQVWATRKGASRRLLRNLDRLTATLATRVLVDSPSQLAFLERERVVDSDKAAVLASGSICGVDTTRFRPDPGARRDVRKSLEVDDDTAVLLYVGRINSDKGIPDLVAALQKLALLEPGTICSLYLAVAGTDEEGLMPNVKTALAAHGIRCAYLGHANQPERLMAAADIFCMPSHREGFGLSVIEAASCQLPSVSSAIYGLSDAVVDGETGLLFPVGNATEMAAAIHRLVSDVTLRHRLGKQARERVEAEFEQRILTAALKAEYEALRTERHHV